MMLTTRHTTTSASTSARTTRGQRNATTARRLLRCAAVRVSKTTTTEDALVATTTTRRRVDVVDENRTETVMWTSPASAVSAMALWSFADGGLAEGTANSYYATLFLFVLSAPGLYSLVKRSAKSKVVRKTFEIPGPKVEGAASQDDMAREISAFFRRNNYVVADAGEVITFEGNIAPERGTAAYITFCVLIGLLCIGLVCSIALPGGDAWYGLALLSPLSGQYYLDNAGRKEQVKVKMVTSDDDMTVDITVEGDQEEVERFRRELDLTPKGMVRVKGVLERA